MLAVTVSVLKKSCTEGNSTGAVNGPVCCELKIPNEKLIVFTLLIFTIKKIYGTSLLFKL